MKGVKTPIGGWSWTRGCSRPRRLGRCAGATVGWARLLATSFRPCHVFRFTRARIPETSERRKGRSTPDQFGRPGRIARCPSPSPTSPLPRFCGCSSAAVGPSSPRTWNCCSFDTCSRFRLVSSGDRGFALPDRAFIAGLARLLPHRRRHGLLVTATTLLRGQSRAGAQELDLSAARLRPTTEGPSAARTGAPARAREPDLGRPKDRGRAPQARFPYLTEHRSASARRGGDGVRTPRLRPAGNAGPRSTSVAVVAMPRPKGVP